MTCDFIVNALAGAPSEQLAAMYSLYAGVKECAGIGRLFVIGGAGQKPPESLSQELLMLNCDDPDAVSMLPELVARNAGGGGLCILGDDSLCLEIAARLAYRLGGQSLLGVNRLRASSNGLTAFKTICAGRLEGCFLLTRSPFFVSTGHDLTRIEFEPLKNAVVETLVISGNSRILSSSRAEEQEPTPFAYAKRLVVAGRGMSDTQGLSAAKRLAAVLGGELGATRPAVMCGAAPLRRMVGISGEIVAPRLCLVGGASGSAALMTGIEKSRFIVAVNTDEEAPIRSCADVFSNGDAAAVFNGLADLIERETNHGQYENKKI